MTFFEYYQFILGEGTEVQISQSLELKWGGEKKQHVIVLPPSFELGPSPWVVSWVATLHFVFKEDKNI